MHFFVNVPTEIRGSRVFQKAKIKENAKPQKSSTASAFSPVSDKLSHTWHTDTQSCPSLAVEVNLSWTVPACAVHVDHTSALYCSFHCGHGKSQCGTEGGGKGSQELWALQGPAVLGIALLTHTDLYMDVNTHTTWIYHAIRGEHSSSAVLKTPQCPSIASNCRKSSTFRSHLVKYLRFCSHRYHLISE